MGSNEEADAQARCDYVIDKSEWQRRIAELEDENASLRADLDALRAENVESQGMFARMRAEWIKLMSKSLTRS
jgi:ABC-type phosphate transport system auxiliary subunit